MNSKLTLAVEYFLERPRMLEKSSGKFLSGVYAKHIFQGQNKEFVFKAKEEARKRIHEAEKEVLQTKNKELEEKLGELIEEQTEAENEFGIRSTTKKFETRRILTDDEIKELAGIDGITNRLGTVWKKLQTSGNWTYSIRVDYLYKDFHNVEELRNKLKELFPNDLCKFTRPKSEIENDEDALFIYISDDHLGMNFKNSLFGNEYSGKIYENRLKHIALNLEAGRYKKLYIVRLGDELDGFNGKTTRETHDLSSASNKEQFDTYVFANRRFYDTIFSSGIASEYEIVNCNNSNHSGLGFSYMANTALEIYLGAKFPDVKVTHVNEFIGIIEWGKHVIGVTHGKDEKYMKKGMPLNLTSDTDLWLKEYYQSKGFNSSDRWISTMKGDLHRYNVNKGKSGRYVNIPSIAGGSHYIEYNFSESEPGILMELVNKNSKDIIHQPIFF